MTAFAVPELAPALPEIVLAVGAMMLLMLGVLARKVAVGVCHAGAIALLLVAGVLVASQDPGRTVTFYGSFVVDGFGRFLKVLILTGSAAAIAMAPRFLKAFGINQFEFPVLILLSTIGMMLMVSANDLMTLYLGVELQSLSAYIIASFHRDNARSSEAGLKYFVLGALSSGMLLYGMSLVYGFTGTIAFEGIAATVRAGAPIGVIFGLVFIMAGLAFKIAAVPFHMWTPDVYEGAPTPVTAFFAGAPKLAAMGMMVRTVFSAFPGIVADWQQIVVFVAIASMALGAFAAIGQRNIKRLLAYSSIGHVGFALVGLAAGTPMGAQGVLIYLGIYLAMTVGTFCVVLSMRRGGQYVEDIAELSGLSRSDPLTAYLLAGLLFSLAGIPPLAGFFAKFYVFLAAVEAGLIPLAVIGVVTSVVSCYYYLRIVKIMFFDEPAPSFDPMPAELKGILLVSSVVVVGFFLFPSLLVDAAGAAARSLF